MIEFELPRIKHLIDAVVLNERIINGSIEPNWKDFRSGRLSQFRNKIIHNFNPCRFFRGSIIALNNPEISHESRYANPPGNLTSIGRCNLPGESVLYTSIDFLGAIQETILTTKNPKVLDSTENVLFVSEWTIDNNYDYRAIDLDFVFPWINTGPLEFFDHVYFNQLNYLFRSHGHYGFSANFSSVVFNGTEINGKRYPIVPNNFDLIIYPSIVKNRKFSNYAFNPRLIKEGKLNLTKIWPVKLAKDYYNTLLKSEFMMHHGIRQYGIPSPYNQGLIRWFDMNIAERAYFASATANISKISFRG